MKAMYAATSSHTHQRFFFFSMFTLIPPHPFVLKLSLILLGIGMVVGLIGSFFSVTRYLRWKR